MKAQLNENDLMEIASRTPGSVSSVQYIAIPLPKSNQNISRSSSTNASFDPILHSNSPIRLLQTDLALFRVIHKRDTRGGLILVEATFSEDGSLLRSDDAFSFVTLWMGGRGIEECEMYVMEDVPEVVRNWDTGAEYRIKDAVHEMMRLYHLAYRSLVVESVERNSVVQPRAVFQGAVEQIASVRVEGVGVFKAFLDQSVFVQFDSAISIRVSSCDAICGKSHWSALDRMHLGVDGAVAVVMDSREGEYQVRVFHPIGVEKEMDHVLQFVDWAFMPDAERTRQMQVKKTATDILSGVLERGRAYLQQNE
ncbi:hypothetical protein HDU98_011260 [Podochytrium sp. JEL0797]|nr:hypothetical protein HDU98_011260 [Podochytrium sp. JEL0797]